MENIFFDRSKLKYCGENVIIGKTVRIRKPEEVSIGDGTIIDDFTYISCGITVGKNCHIASNVSISGSLAHLYVGDYTTISHHSSIHCASSEYDTLSLDLPSVPEKLRFGGTYEDVNIGKYCVIGAHTCILPGTNIPDGFASGAHSLIKKIKYLPYSLYAGIPAKFIKERTGKDEFFKRLGIEF